MKLDLTGKVAVVTGGGGGLGSAEAAALAAAGADVAVVDLSEAKARPVAEAVAASTGRRAIALGADIADAAAVDAMTAAVVARLGRLDILVNNAALYYPKRAWTEIPVADWDRLQAVNLRGYYLCSRAAFPHMRSVGAGKIVNIASITVHGTHSELLDYVTSKGGILSFTRALAREVGPHNITVNAISPGAFPTDGEKIHPDREGYNRYILEQQALKRRGRPEDLAAVVLFFCSPASDFITGQTLNVDGGWVMD